MRTLSFLLCLCLLACGFLGCEKADKKPKVESPKNAVVLIESGPNKIEMVKLVRELTGMSLKDAKNKVENPPATIIDDCDRAKALKASASLQKLGAKVEIR